MSYYICNNKKGFLENRNKEGLSSPPDITYTNRKSVHGEITNIKVPDLR